MQMERRARKAAASGAASGMGYGFGMTGGYSYGGGYGMTGGYGYGTGGCTCGTDVVVKPRKHNRKKRYGAYGAGPVQFPHYDPGVVIHYGPVVTYSGGY